MTNGMKYMPSEAVYSYMNIKCYVKISSFGDKERSSILRKRANQNQK